MSANVVAFSAKDGNRVRVVHGSHEVFQVQTIALLLQQSYRGVVMPPRVACAARLAAQPTKRYMRLVALGVEGQ